MTGTVQRLAEFGAFVDVKVPGDEEAVITGLVHVSEISETFVENIYAHLAEGDEVDVAVMDVKEDGKVDLSIKRADPDWLDEDTPDLRPKTGKDFNRQLRRFMHTSQMRQGEVRRQKKGRLGVP